MNLFEQAIDAIQQGWERSWFRWLFRRTMIGHVLSAHDRNVNPSTTFAIIQAYLQSGWFARWWFRGYISNYVVSSAFDAVVRFSALLRDADQLRDKSGDFPRHSNALWIVDNFNCIQTNNDFCDKTQIVNALIDLHRVGILTPENRDAIREHATPCIVADALVCLNRNGILTPENRDAIKTHDTHDKFKNIADALNKLSRNNMLTQDNFNVIKNHSNPLIVADALVYLNSNGILTSANRAAIKTYDTCDKLNNIADALNALSYNNMLTQNNFNVIKNHSNPLIVADALRCLNSAGILTSENRDAIREHATPCIVADALVCLNSNGILTSENRDAIKTHDTHDKFKNIADALNKLSRNNMLTQDNFNVIKNHSNPLIVADALVCLNRNGILTSANRDVIKTHTRDYSQALSYLSYSHYMHSRHSVYSQPPANTAYFGSILTQENFDAIATHSCPDAVVEAVIRLHEQKILTQENFDVIKMHLDPCRAADALIFLESAGILSSNNRAVITTCANINAIVTALDRLQCADLLTQENFNILFNQQYAALLTNEATNDCWVRLSDRLLEAYWKHILEALRNQVPLRECVNQLLACTDDQPEDQPERRQFHSV